MLVPLDYDDNVDVRFPPIAASVLEKEGAPVIAMRGL
jgi:hypothetical protein